ncbi:MAG: DUF4258 domain-containing protein [Candidatus Thermoplasmatota archaeon]
MRFLFSRHARVRMVERGVSADEVRTAIAKGVKRRQEDRIVASYAYFEVVYRKRGDDVFVITVKPRW